VWEGWAGEPQGSLFGWAGEPLHNVDGHCYVNGHRYGDGLGNCRDGLGNRFIMCVMVGDGKGERPREC